MWWTNNQSNKTLTKETLLKGKMCNCAGFLVKEVKKHIHVPKKVVATKEHYLEEYLVVVNFIDSKHILLAFVAWLMELNAKVGQAP